MFIMKHITFQQRIMLTKRCIHKHYGQLGTLRTQQGAFGPLRCFNYGKPSRCSDKISIINLIECEDLISFRCLGKQTIQDYTPRKFSFSFGFPCNSLGIVKKLNYRFTISATNETTCSKLLLGDTCQPYMQFGAFPNLFGEAQMSTIFERTSSCFELFQHALKFFCNFFILKCDPESKQIIPPCREMCYEYLDTCLVGNKKYVKCNYLPSSKGDLRCFYEPLACSEPPPAVTNAKLITNFIKRGKYFLPEIAEYTCDAGYILEGNKSISCLYDGHWSTPPKCLLENKYISKFAQSSPIEKTTPNADFIPESTGATTNNSTLHFLVIVSLFVLVVLLLVIVAGGYKIKLELKKARDLGAGQGERGDSKMCSDATSPWRRTRPFDATLFYHFDTDDSFVINNLLPELEENRNFKLCFHSRNFTPGRDIKDNIEEAIEASNSAIIVMSQGVCGQYLV